LIQTTATTRMCHSISKQSTRSLTLHAYTTVPGFDGHVISIVQPPKPWSHSASKASTTGAPNRLVGEAQTKPISVLYLLVTMFERSWSSSRPARMNMLLIMIFLQANTCHDGGLSCATLRQQIHENAKSVAVSCQIWPRYRRVHSLQVCYTFPMWPGHLK
jgi:hypothetical protein